MMNPMEMMQIHRVYWSLFDLFGPSVNSIFLKFYSPMGIREACNIFQLYVPEYHNESIKVFLVLILN